MAGLYLENCVASPQIFVLLDSTYDLTKKHQGQGQDE
jgi:hypothetical protein